MALFPGRYRNPGGATPVTYQWFHLGFKAWVDDLGIGRWVAHQARHTLATSLLRHGATLTHIRRYLGHVSDRMAEHYVQLSHSDLEDVLQHVWVAGPGTTSPGKLLSSPATAITREQAQALAIDLSRRSTPAEGGFCTFQPVVAGGACPWNLDCGNCGKFVLSGADLLYWRRKREQWYSIAERAPDDATASWLHEVFAPTAAAIDGLEAALAGLGLLDDALALDLRRPQHYSRPHRGRDRGPPPRHRAETAAGPRRRRQPQAPQGAGHLPGRRPPGRGITHLPLRQPRRPGADQRRHQQVRHPARPGPRRSGAILAGTRAQRRGGAEGSPGRDRRPAAPPGHPPRPDPRPGTRPVTGGRATAGHREHHAQAAPPPAQPRQQDPGRPARSRPLQQPVRRPAHRPARSPAHRARPSPLRPATLRRIRPPDASPPASRRRHARNVKA